MATQTAAAAAAAAAAQVQAQKRAELSREMEKKRSILDKEKDREYVPLSSLAGRVAELIPYFIGKQDKFLVANVPDERTLRMYLNKGLISRPLRKEGAASVFGYIHLIQILAVKYFQSKYMSLRKIEGIIPELDVQGLEDVLISQRIEDTDKIDTREVEKALSLRQGKKYIGLRQLLEDIPSVLSVFMPRDESSCRIAEGALRFYQDVGVMDKPIGYQGRAAILTYKNLLQVVMIKCLQKKYFPISRINNMMKGLDEKQLEGILLRGDFDKFILDMNYKPTQSEDSNSKKVAGPARVEWYRICLQDALEVNIKTDALPVDAKERAERLGAIELKIKEILPHLETNRSKPKLKTL